MQFGDDEHCVQLRHAEQVVRARRLLTPVMRTRRRNERMIIAGDVRVQSLLPATITPPIE